MSLHGIVKHLDEIKYLTSGFIACRIDLFLGDSLFKFREETLCNCVIVTVSSTTHRWFKIVFFQESQVVSTTILATLIAMNKYRLCGLSLPDRHQQRVENQMPINGFIHRPTHDSSRKQIQYRSKIQEPFIGSDLSNVANPCLIGRSRTEVTIQMIGSNADQPATLDITTLVTNLRL